MDPRGLTGGNDCAGGVSHAVRAVSARGGGPHANREWRRGIVGLAALAAILLAGISAGTAVPTADEVLIAIGFSADQKQQVMDGQLVSLTPSPTFERELAVVLAFLVKQPPAELDAHFQAGASYRLDPGITAYGVIADPGSLAELSNLTLTPDGANDAQRYLHAAPGEALNLSPAEIADFQALNDQIRAGADPQQLVNEQLRRMLLARYQAYRSRGLAGIAPYARAGGKLYQPANDLRKETATATGLRQYAPELANVLLQYPQDVPTSGFQQTFFWVNYELDGRPNLVLSHYMSQRLGPHAYLTAARQYYASWEYNTVQEFEGMLPVQEGTVVLYTNRTSTDQAAGFGSSVKRAVGQQMMIRQLSQIFNNLRTQAAGK